MDDADVTVTGTDQEEAEIRSIHLIRGAIITAYSQAEFLLADMYFRARCLDQYSHLPNKLPYRLETRIKFLKRLADMPGPIASF